MKTLILFLLSSLLFSFLKETDSSVNSTFEQPKNQFIKLYGDFKVKNTFFSGTKEHLIINPIVDNTLKGEYYLDKNVILFYSVVDEKNQLKDLSLTINKTSQLIISRKSNSDLTLMIKINQKKAEYNLSKNENGFTLNNFKGEKNLFFDFFKNANIQSLLPSFSRFIGEKHGLQGNLFPAAMPFHQIAMNAGRLINPPPQHRSPPDDRSTPIPVDTSTHSPSTTSTTSTSGTSSNCNQPDINNECLGLCGRKCDCWQWVCGDCNCHRGCRDHDVVTGKCLDFNIFNCIPTLIFVVTAIIDCSSCCTLPQSQCPNGKEMCPVTNRCVVIGKCPCDSDRERFCRTTNTCILKQQTCPTCPQNTTMSQSGRCVSNLQ